MKRSSRIFKIAFFIILLIVGALYIVGRTCGELEYQTKVEMEAPLDFSWSVFQDPTHMRAWINGFQRIEMVDGEIGQPESIYNIILVNDGQEITVEQTIVEMRPPELMKYNICNEFVKGSTTVEFSAEMKNTAVVVTSKVHGMNAFKNLLVHLGEGHLCQQEQDNWSRLKQLVETKYAGH